jgi:hypothetical protein
MCRSARRAPSASEATGITFPMKVYAPDDYQLFPAAVSQIIDSGKS